MNAAPCSCRVVMWRTTSWRLSASRTSIVASPGTEKTYSQPSAARHSTSSVAAVRGAWVMPGSLRDVRSRSSGCDRSCVAPYRWVVWRTVHTGVGSPRQALRPIAGASVARDRRRGPSSLATLSARHIEDDLGPEPPWHGARCLRAARGPGGHRTRWSATDPHARERDRCVLHARPLVALHLREPRG